MLTFSRYKHSRFWAVYEDGVLLCLTVYKRGAGSVVNRIEKGDLPCLTSIASSSLDTLDSSLNPPKEVPPAFQLQ